MPESQQPSKSQSQPLALYNPALLPPQLLLAEFTARRPLLDALIEIVRNNTPDKPLQHALLVGSRGMGKTTTLLAVAYTIERDAELSRQWLPVVFDEESRRVGDLADFWLEALRQWELAAKDPEDRAQKLLDKPAPNIEDAARNSFLEKVDRSGRRALLLVDNLNDLLASIHDAEPLHRLRAFLMEDTRVMLLGTATRYFDQISHLDQPFHDFFRSFDLRPLTLEEMKAALLALAEARGDKSVPVTLKERAGSIQGLYLLTGGNPRLIKTFYRLITEGLRGDIRTDLERLLDEFTPYFKAVVDALPVQQQCIFDAVALHWDPVEVATVSRVTRVASNQISAQLRALIKAGLIAEHAGHPKRKTYLLADRFSNIHYLMRHGRAARNRFDWFVALVRLVFPDTQAETLAKLAHQAAGCGPDGMRDARDLMHSALMRAESADSRRQLLHAAFRETWDTDALASLSDWLDLTEAKEHMPEVEIVTFFGQMPREMRTKLGYQPANARWWFDLAHALEKHKAWPLVELSYRKSAELEPKSAPTWACLGFVLDVRLSRTKEAEQLLRKAIEIDPGDPFFRILLGNTLERLNRLPEAEVAFKEVIRVNPNSDLGWGWLGAMLVDQKTRYDEAEKLLERAVQLSPKDSLYHEKLAECLAMLGKLGEAEVEYKNLLQIDPQRPSAWRGLGAVLMKQQCGRTSEAEQAFRRAITLDSKDVLSWCHLTQVLDRDPTRIIEAGSCMAETFNIAFEKGIPESPFDALLEDPLSCTSYLKYLAACSLVNPKQVKFFDFTVNCFIKYARLTKPADALVVLESLPDPSPFETLSDAFRAHAEPEHLSHLAPERRAVVMKLLERLNSGESKQSQTG